MGIEIDRGEECAENNAAWRQEVRKGTKRRDAALNQEAAEKRQRRTTGMTVMIHSMALDTRKTVVP